MKVDVTKVWIDDTYVHILTSEGVERMEAIDNYERLHMATPEQLQNFETDNIGIHWPELDEDLSYEGFFKADVMEERSELYVLFKRFPQINVAGIARSLGIKQSLMAAYVCLILSHPYEIYIHRDAKILPGTEIFGNVFNFDVV